MALQLLLSDFLLYMRKILFISVQYLQGGGGCGVGGGDGGGLGVGAHPVQRFPSLLGQARC